MGVFLEDLKAGESVEAEVLPLLRKHLPSGYFYAHDPQQKTHDLKFVNPFKSKVFPDYSKSGGRDGTTLSTAAMNVEHG